MKINKLKIKEKKFDINLQFYYFLKHLVKSKLNDEEISKLIEIIGSKKSAKLNGVLEEMNLLFSQIKNDEKRGILALILSSIKNNLDLDLFNFSLKIYSIKDLLLQEAKIKEVITADELSNLDPLSLEYDNLSVKRPYATRVNGALIALLFFSNLEERKTNFMSQEAHNFIKDLSNMAINLKKCGLEPNQIFMLMFTESMNQSIISDSGTNYESRILSVLTKMGIPEDKIKKIHDKNDSSTEFDFFFDIDGRTFGIGAKRTLRERYKQFIKTAQMSRIDVMIEITLGVDLNETKAKSILSHGIHLFVSDEIYKSRTFLQKLKGVYSVKKLNLQFLKSLP
jgi:hypothetical protein